MCGITGYYNATNAFSHEGLQAATRSIAHRGPDAEGYFLDDHVGLGHKRLSIIDLSEAANQPMHSHNNRFVIVYNGEVYNFAEIAAKLKLRTRTVSDTEVLLEAFVQWGVEFVNELNGMFSIAIYDKVENRLHLFRDRMGIKPLFYYWDGSNFAFASELKALLKFDIINAGKVINRSAVRAFLHLGYIPSPLTIYENVSKFPAGSFGTLEAGQLDIQPYWKIENKIAKEQINDLRSAKKVLKELVTSSIKHRLISDVPYGSFLSGGTDSSLVTAVAQSISPQPIKTFSIGFNESKYNELPHAKAISDYLKTDHHELIVSYQDAIPLVEELTEIYDEPYADSSAIPTLLVSKMAKQHVKMTLSGDGGDELFFGYGSYIWANRLAHPVSKVLKRQIGSSLSLFSNKYKRAAHLFQYSKGNNLQSHIFSQESYLFREDELSELLADDYSSIAMPLTPPDNPIRPLNPVEEQALFDMRYYLPDDLLVKIDRASMQNSLETRVPLLDHRIIEFALNLAPELKLKGDTQKLILKEVLYDYIPKSYFNRPKWGFSIPLKEWMQKELKHLILEYLSEAVIEQFSIVKYSVVKRLKDDFFGGQDYLYNRLWVLICLHKFLIRHIQ